MVDGSTIMLEESKNPQDIERMFSRIAPRYDLANRVLSAGLDMSWRRKGVRLADPSNDAAAMDMGCGTCDMISILLKRTGYHGNVVGVDLSDPMLKLGKSKLSGIKTEGTYELRKGNTLTQDDPNSTYDLIMTCFGIRNFSDTANAFSEVTRLLKPGGRFLVIEFFALEHEPWYVRLYLKYILPALGAIVSGRSFAYSYLSRSKTAFYTVEGFIELGVEEGLSLFKRQSLSFGVADIVIFEKPA